ncbi:E3 ubiquitin-protein ligase RNF216-like [Leptopilina heterotoma]|uniref:E3 ubiquitin-protein ligase RNF216-like n=1 Tax=Leptopilina heterotoma TaxID=63436 RepID=UPI001CA9E738|nr:E3 ubiquitin-protein ligase RNF216-like [Leptopilina heterotoma]XP_043481937.1 E3 ubiquitin-protein ligase RNF216-like [Leptopilina heterotoma]
MDQIDKNNLQKVELDKASAPQRPVAGCSKEIINIQENENELTLSDVLEALEDIRVKFAERTEEFVRLFANTEGDISKRIENEEEIGAIHSLAKNVSTLNLSDDGEQPPTVKPVAIASSSKTDELYCKDTYYKLRGIFPNIDPSFIKEKCKNPPFNMMGLSKEEQLNMFVAVLLADGSNHEIPIEISDESDEVDENKDEQYESLLEIFPEADPEYLRKIVDTCNGQKLENFIQTNLEKPNYPTRAEFLEKMKKKKIIRDHTTEFSVDKFLQMFPKPIEYFENPARKCEYNVNSKLFLTDYFNKHKIVTIQAIYRKNNFNLSLTANVLQNKKKDLVSKRRTNYSIDRIQEMALVQEITYIKFKNEIVQYLEDTKKRDEEDFKRCKEQGLLVECQCCFSNECLPKKCFACDGGHLFCNTCILVGSESKIGDGLYQINCFEDCEREFSLSVLQNVLPPSLFSILLQKRQEAEIIAAGIEGLVSCPFCHFASIPPPETKVFKCLNPDCMKETCRSCKALNHVPLSCEELVKEDEARLKLEENMTKALVRTCYKCQKPFFKEEGCNKMTCMCGASMCYLCLTPLQQGDYKHFNGQGAENANLCPLWSDDKRMNAEAVRRIAEVTESELKKKNPNLQLTAKSILPALPQKVKGPHENIPNADALPEHILRMANNP